MARLRKVDAQDSLADPHSKHLVLPFGTTSPQFCTGPLAHPCHSHCNSHAEHPCQPVHLHQFGRFGVSCFWQEFRDTSRCGIVVLGIRHLCDTGHVRLQGGIYLLASDSWGALRAVIGPALTTTMEDDVACFRQTLDANVMNAHTYISPRCLADQWENSNMLSE